MADGNMRIITRIDNSKLNKDLKETTNSIKQIESELNKNTDNVDKMTSKYNEINQKIRENEQAMKKIIIDTRYIAENENMIVKLTQQETRERLSTNQQYQNLMNKTVELYQNAEIYNKKINESKSNISNLKTKLEEAKNKQNEYKRKIEESEAKQNELNLSTKGISKELSGGIRKILRYGAALLSIRSIYGLLSNAANSWLSGNNSVAKQLRADIDYMKNAIGHALSPVIKYIVDLLYQALGFTGALIKAFTGVDIFAGSVADYMSKTTSSANKTNKELKKQLLSFDRINKLNDDSSNSSGGSGVGTIAPSQDLSKIMEKYTEQAEKLKDIFEKIKDFAPVIGSMFAAWKIGELLSDLGLLKGSLKEIEKIKPVIGISLVIGSVVSSIGTINKLADGEINSETIMSSILESLGLGGGLALLGVGLPITIPLAITLLVIKALAAVDSKLKIDEKFWKPLYDHYGFEYSNDLNFAQWWIRVKIGFNLLNDSSAKIREFFFNTWEDIKQKITEIGNNIKKFGYSILLDAIEDIAKWIKNIPVIGYGIGSAIESGVKAMKGEITSATKQTIEESTTDATNRAKNTVRFQGIKTADAFAEGINNEIRLSKNELRKSIEDSNTNATNESKNTVNNNGKNIGNIFAEGEKDTIFANSQSLSTTMKESLNKATDSSVNTATNSGKTIGTKVTEGIKETERAKQNDLSNNLTNVVKEANRKVDTSSAKDVGVNIVTGIDSGINNKKSTLFGTIAGLGTTLFNVFKKNMEIRSPSKKMASLAKFIPLGIAEGIDSTQDKAIGSMKNLVGGLEDTMSDIDYSNITEVPKIPRNAVTYIPKQSISTNEVQRSIIGQDSSVINKLLSNLQTGTNKNTTVTIPLIIDGEEFIKKTIELNGNYNLATNGGGL